MDKLNRAKLSREAIALLSSNKSLTLTSHRFSAAPVDPGMSTELHFPGLLDILSSMPAGPFVARG